MDISVLMLEIVVEWSVLLAVVMVTEKPLAASANNDLATNGSCGA